MDKHKVRIMEVASRNTLMTHEKCILKWGEEKGNKVFDKMVRELMRWNGVENRDIHIIKTDSDGRK